MTTPTIGKLLPTTHETAHELLSTLIYPYSSRLHTIQHLYTAQAQLIELINVQAAKEIELEREIVRLNLRVQTLEHQHLNDEAGNQLL